MPMPSTPLPRRTVLATGGALGAAAVLAACGGGGTDGSGDSSPSSQAPAVDPTDSGGEILGPVSAVSVGSGVVYDGPKVVVTQPSPGEIRGFTAVCPHQGCLVSEVTDNEILCPCHGSLFSAEDGAVLVGPATTGLAPVQVAVLDDQVVLD